MQNEPTSSPHARVVPWIAVAVMVLASLALVAYLKTGQAIEHTVNAVVAKAPEIAARFKTGTITRTFIEENTVIAPNAGGLLETTTIQSTESFRHEDTRRVLWDTLSLGTTISEIRVPVTFRYHVRLADSWRIVTQGHVCKVFAPAIRSSLPAAIHTDRLEKRSEEGWLRLNGQANLRELERSLTSELGHRAADPNHVALAREASRQVVAAFIRDWLQRDAQWGQDQFNAIVVAFPDELPTDSDLELERYQHDPTIKFEQKN